MREMTHVPQIQMKNVIILPRNVLAYRSPYPTIKSHRYIFIVRRISATCGHSDDDVPHSVSVIVADVRGIDSGERHFSDS